VTAVPQEIQSADNDALVPSWSSTFSKWFVNQVKFLEGKKRKKSHNLKDGFENQPYSKYPVPELQSCHSLLWFPKKKH